MKSQNALHFSVPLMAMMLLLVLPSGLLSAADSLDVSRFVRGVRHGMPGGPPKQVLFLIFRAQTEGPEVQGF